MAPYSRTSVLIGTLSLLLLLVLFPPRTSGEFAFITRQGFEYGVGTIGPVDPVRFLIVFLALALVGGVLYWKAPDGKP